MSVGRVVHAMPVVDDSAGDIPDTTQLGSLQLSIIFFSAKYIVGWLKTYILFLAY